MGFLVDARADESQQEAMQAIFGGQAGGWPAAFADKLGSMLGMEPAEFEFEVASDLSSWRAEVPGKIKAEVEVLQGPTSVPGKVAQVHNPPGSEVGPGSIATYGRRSPTSAMCSDSAGTTRASRASTWRSTGRGPTEPGRPAPTSSFSPERGELAFTAWRSSTS